MSQRGTRSRETARVAQTRAAARPWLLAACLIVTVLALFTAIGWALEIDLLRQPVGASTTKFASALGLAALAMALLVWWLRHPTVAAVLGGVGPVIGVIVLLEYGGILPNSLTDSLVTDTLTGDSGVPGRPGWNTAVCLILLGVGLILLCVTDLVALGQLLATITGLVAYLSLIGHIMLVDVILPASSWTQMSMVTTVCLLLLATGALLMRPGEGFLSEFNSRWLGGKVARWIGGSALVLGVLLALMVRWLIYVDAPRPVPAQIIITLSVPALLLLGALLGAQLNRSDAQRTRVARIGTALANTLQGVLLVSRDGTILEANQAAADLLALSPQAVRGRSVDEFVPQEHLSAHPDRREEFWSKGLDRKMASGLNTTLIDSAGRSHDVEISLAFIRDEETPSSLVVTISDTSELVRANHELNQFVYVASHDLRAPLRAITGFAELLRLSLEDDTLSPEQREYLDEVQQGTAQMQRLIDALLDYSRIGRSGNEPKPTNVAEQVERVLRTLSLDLDAAGATDDVVLADTLTWTVDPDLLDAALINIVTNSLKYRSDDRDLHLDIHAQLEGRSVSLTIRDNGTGIDPDQLDRATAMFQRLTTSQSGLGIGLASVKRIVEYQGGTLTLDSDGEHYTAVTISLPGSDQTHGQKP